MCAGVTCVGGCDGVMCAGVKCVGQCVGGWSEWNVVYAHKFCCSCPVLLFISRTTITLLQMSIDRSSDIFLIVSI